MNGRRGKKRSFILILVIVFPFLHLWGEGPFECSEKSRGGLLLLPKNDEIEEWKRDGENLTAPNPTDLFKIINGGASLYVKYGFQSYCGQTYKNSKDVELEVSVFDQGNPQNARQLY